MAQRGWDQSLVQQTVDLPYTTRVSTNLATGNPATAYYMQEGAYVIVDDVTREIVQVSNRFDPNSVPDPNIVDPYIP